MKVDFIYSDLKMLMLSWLLNHAAYTVEVAKLVELDGENEKWEDLHGFLEDSGLKEIPSSETNLVHDFNSERFKSKI